MLTKNKMLVVVLLLLAGGARADNTEITPEAAEAAGIKTEVVAGTVVSETILLNGHITLNQNSMAQVKARFPGIVHAVERMQGEEVRAGDVLAKVEGNDSLQVYPVKSPLSGTILMRNANVGDAAGETPLFTVADMSSVWAEFHVFPHDIERIRSGQTVHVVSMSGEHSADAAITLVSPVAEASSQTVVARVTLPNKDGTWHSGMTVSGEVGIREKQVAVAVKTPALQRMEGKEVVFVKQENRYSARPVKTGIGNSQWTEITEGLKAGETYVSENSFIIKADIGKNSVEGE